jgi:hypothetical protein
MRRQPAHRVARILSALQIGSASGDRSERRPSGRMTYSASPSRSDYRVINQSALRRADGRRPQLRGAPVFTRVSISPP